MPKFKGTCDHPAAQQHPARMRGSKMRVQCKVCLYLGPWVPNPEYQPKGVEPDTKVGLLKTTTVADLKQMAKDRHVPGYSKMKKNELIEALS